MREVTLQHHQFSFLYHISFFGAFVMTKSPFEVPTIHRFLPVLLYQTVFVEEDLVSLISSGTTLRHYSPASYILSHISYYEIRSLLLK